MLAPGFYSQHALGEVLKDHHSPASSFLVYLLCQMLSGTVLQVELPSLVFASLKDTNMGTINYPNFITKLYYYREEVMWG